VTFFQNQERREKSLDLTNSQTVVPESFNFDLFISYSRHDNRWGEPHLVLTCN